MIGRLFVTLKTRCGLDAGESACDISLIPMKIIATITLTNAQRGTIAAAAPDAELVCRQCRSREEAAELVADGCDILLTFLIPNDLPKNARNLKWIQLLSAGADHALGSLKGTTIPVTTASGIHATPIAEYTLASMLAWTRRLHVTLRAQPRHDWSRRAVINNVDVIRGKTLGIVGYGSIGRETARLGAAFGMRVLALKRDPSRRRDTGWCSPGVGDPEGRIPERWVGVDGCADLLSESDYVSVTLPNTPHTVKFVGAKEIAAMKAGSYIVNIGRGAVIDEAALVEALRAGRIGGAGLDVFEKEPLPAESPLWDIEEAILTPHVSGDFHAYQDLACQLFAENLRRFKSNRELLNVVDPALGY
jgi:phosphoglycerate dehydrogenase-like enzyme